MSSVKKTLHIPTEITCLALQRVVVSFISNRGVTLMSVCSDVSLNALPCLPCLPACQELLNLFCRAGLCLLKKPGMVCAFSVGELCTSADVEAENERSRLYFSCQQQPFRAGT